MIVLLNISPIWSVVGGFLVILTSFLPLAWMCMIWFNIHIYSWRLVLIMSLSLRDLMTCNLLDFPVSCWLDMVSTTCWSVVGYFLPIMRIQTSFMFLAVNSWFHGLLFSDWDIYDMLWCSKYFLQFQWGFLLVEIYIDFKYIIFDKRMIWEVNF